MTKALTILNTKIRTNDGLYSLNDLHKAAGGEKRHQPALWLRIDQAKELIEEIQSTDMQSTPVKAINGGPYRGTYACRELVYAYAMWISARFHLTVIRAFDALVNPPGRTISPAQAGELATLVAQRAGDQGKPRAYYWSRFNNHFHLARYRELPADRFDEAVEYLKTMPDEHGNPPRTIAGRTRLLVTIEGNRIIHSADASDCSLVDTRGLATLRRNLATISQQLKWLTGEESAETLDKPLENLR